MTRKNISSGAKWEDLVGYSRAVILDNTIHISGTTATDKEGNIIGKDSPYRQTKFIFEKIKNLLHENGSDMDDIYRTRMFVTDITRWEDYGKAHAEFFVSIKPTTTMIEVSRLIDPDMLIEIEVEAEIGSKIDY